MCKFGRYGSYFSKSSFLSHKIQQYEKFSKSQRLFLMKNIFLLKNNCFDEKIVKFVSLRIIKEQKF